MLLSAAILCFWLLVLAERGTVRHHNLRTITSANCYNRQYEHLSLHNMPNTCWVSAALVTSYPNIPSNIFYLLSLEYEQLTLLSRLITSHNVIIQVPGSPPHRMGVLDRNPFRACQGPGRRRSRGIWIRAAAYFVFTKLAMLTPLLYCSTCNEYS